MIGDYRRPEDLRRALEDRLKEQGTASSPRSRTATSTMGSSSRSATPRRWRAKPRVVPVATPCDA